MQSLRDTLVEVYRQAIFACDLERLTATALTEASDTARLVGDAARILLVACGKGAPAQARAVAAALFGRTLHGLVIAPAGVPGPVPAGFEVMTAGHPLPTPASVAAATQALTRVRALGPRDVALFAISGGASALLTLPAEGLSLADKVATTELLLGAGADIGAINVVRKHLSAVKGGNLARGVVAPSLTLLASDVLGSDPATIGSGPTVPDPSTYEQAGAIMRSADLVARVPSAVVRHLERGARGELAETVKPQDAIAATMHAHVVAGPEHLLAAARAHAAAAGFTVSGGGLGAPSESVETVAAEVASLAPELARRVESTATPHAAVWVREPVVRVQSASPGQGGRNSHLALLVARSLAAASGSLAPLASLAFLAAGSDGIDGTTAAAGAVVDSRTWEEARSLGLDGEASLRSYDSGTWCARAGAAIVTGRTGTNLLDLELLVAAPRT